MISQFEGELKSGACWCWAEVSVSVGSAVMVRLALEFLRSSLVLVLNWRYGPVSLIWLFSAIFHKSSVRPVHGEAHMNYLDYLSIPSCFTSLNVFLFIVNYCETLSVRGSSLDQSWQFSLFPVSLCESRRKEASLWQRNVSVCTNQ